MAVSKVILNGTTEIDLTGDSADVSEVKLGETFHLADGTQGTGTMSPPSGTKNITISASGTTTEDVTNYASAAISVPAGSATTPQTQYSIPSSSIHKTVSASGLVGILITGSVAVTPNVVSGYVASGTSGTVSMSASDEYQLPTYAGAHHAVSNSYSVTITLTNPVNEESFEGCAIFQALSSDPWDSGEQIGSITSPTGSTTVFLDPSIYGVGVYPMANWVNINDSTSTCSSGITYITTDTSAGVILFEVTASGTIEVSGVNYYDD